jgi:hypothetical protein
MLLASPSLYYKEKRGKKGGQWSLVNLIVLAEGDRGGRGLVWSLVHREGHENLLILSLPFWSSLYGY